MRGDICIEYSIGIDFGSTALNFARSEKLSMLTKRRNFAGSNRSFRSKPLHDWSSQDTADWLDSLFLNEYKPAFLKKNVDGQKLLHLSNELLLALGVQRVGHRLHMERSLKHHLHASSH